LSDNTRFLRLRCLIQRISRITVCTWSVQVVVCDSIHLIQPTVEPLSIEHTTYTARSTETTSIGQSLVVIGSDRKNVV